MEFLNWTETTPFSCKCHSCNNSCHVALLTQFKIYKNTKKIQKYYWRQPKERTGLHLCCIEKQGYSYSSYIRALFNEYKKDYN